MIDNEDNCPDDLNSGQEDFDEDGIGNVCDDNGSPVDAGPPDNPGPPAGAGKP